MNKPQIPAVTNRNGYQESGTQVVQKWQSAAEIEQRI